MDAGYEISSAGDISTLYCMRCRLPLAVLVHAGHTREQIDDLWELQLREVRQLALTHRCRGRGDRDESP
jgi:hypothetical protein